jgi:outer membrane lipase/esterase
LALQTEAARSGASDASITAVAIAAAVAAGNTAAASGAVNGPIILAAQAAASTAGQAYFSANAASGVSAVASAANELAVLVKNEIVAKGATHVVVLNIPDLASTPYALEQSAAVQSLVAQMVSTFNSLLAAGVSGDSKIVVVDAYTVNHDQIVNPAPYGLSNVTTRACDVKDLSKNPLGSSLVCNAGNLISGDVTHYLFADDVHPTPFGYLLLARYVSGQLLAAGWL